VWKKASTLPAGQPLPAVTPEFCIAAACLFFARDRLRRIVGKLLDVVATNLCNLRTLSVDTGCWIAVDRTNGLVAD